ncbi:MAG TPA: lipid-A-disaccharide synthase [Rhodocyclaceae bacterium]|nr:lipid-A-disaccharide synthase [Rhodocyclaceae bacterium]
MPTVTVAMVAGEASGDLLAAHLIVALKRHLPGARFVGIGGPKMQREGFDAWWPSEKLAVRGYAEVLRHYREITGIRRQLLSRLLDEQPDVFIGVDAPDFNLWLEQRLKAKGVPAIHYVSPSVWAWRAGRLGRIGKAVSHMLALFPFEPELYRQRGIPVSYVGHPLADMIPLAVDHAGAKEELDVAKGGPVFALLPGSRQSELRYMAELCIETAKNLLARFPDSVFLVPLISRETRLLFEEALWKCGAREMPFKLLFGHAREALAACDAALVASGTATLEAALLRVPMVIAYRMSPWSWRLMRRMRLQPWVGLPNILAGRFVVPEFLQDDATADNLAQALGNLVTDSQAKAGIERVFSSLHRQMRQDTAEKAAEAILPHLRTI